MVATHALWCAPCPYRLRGQERVPRVGSHLLRDSLERQQLVPHAENLRGGRKGGEGRLGERGHGRERAEIVGEREGGREGGREEEGGTQLNPEFSEVTSSPGWLCLQSVTVSA